ncbi:MAG TPA: SH3 domain-containing protein [Acidobacteriaceae bacterium]
MPLAVQMRAIATAVVLTLPFMVSGCGVAAFEGMEAIEARSLLAAAPEIEDIGLAGRMPTAIAIDDEGIGYVNGTRAFSVDLANQKIRSLSTGDVLATFDTAHMYSSSGRVIADIDTIILRRSSLFNFGSVRSTQVAMVPAGARVRVLAVKDGWYQLGFADGIMAGWVFAPPLKMQVSNGSGQPIEYKTQPREYAAIGAVLSSADAVRSSVRQILYGN